MKKVIAFLTILVLNTFVSAGNPDERPSIEVMFAKEFTKFDYELIEDESTSPTAFGAQFISPLSDNVSLKLGTGFGSESFDKSETSVSSFYISVGLKIYLSAQLWARPAGSGDLPETIRYKQNTPPQDINAITEGFTYFSEFKNESMLIYSVTAINKSWEDLENFSRIQEGGDSTKMIILYFDDPTFTPDISKSGLYFDDKYRPHWIATYHRYPGGVSMLKRPDK